MEQAFIPWSICTITLMNIYYFYTITKSKVDIDTLWPRPIYLVAALAGESLSFSQLAPAAALAFWLQP